jgi:hypothetical protein
MVSPQAPSAFDPKKETIPFLARMKKRAGKDFRWTRSRSLEAATLLAYWLHVFGKDDEALEVCAFVGQYEFAGNHDFWTWVESSLALQSRILRSRSQKEKSAQCIERIRAANFVQERLKGQLIYGENGYKVGAEDAQKEGDTKLEQEWRIAMVQELTVLIELGGSKRLSPEKLEKEYKDNLARLRELVGAQ